MAFPQPRPIQLLPGYGPSRSPNQSSAALINVYGEAGEGKGAWTALGYPGRRVLVDRELPDRGLYVSDRGPVYGVAGTTLYRLNDALSAAETLGTIPGTDRVEWAENRSQIAVCADGWVYVYNIATGYLHGRITDATFKGASSICSVGGWGVYVVPGSDEFYISALNDFREIDSLQFATAEARSDVVVAVRAVDNIPWFLGRRTVEPWAPQAKAGFPFARVGVNPSVGCVSRDTALNFDKTLYWLGTSGQNEGLCVYRANGYAAERVSTHAVERLLERSRFPDRARAHAVSFEGHAFYTITTDAGSVALDAASGEWHQTASGTWPLAGDPPPSRITSQVYVGTRSIVADDLGRICELSFDNEDPSGELVREIVTAPMGALGRRTVINRLGLDIEPGRGTLTDEAEVILSLSRDGGHTWDAPRTAKIGKAGATGVVGAQWWALGMANEFCARFRMTGNWPFRVNGAWAEITKLDAR